MNEQNYTSLELSKKLKEGGCELESGMFLCSDLGELTFSKNCYPYRAAKCGEHMIVYDILNDICVKYAKEFFGEKENSKILMCNQCGSDFEDKKEFLTSYILQILQKGKKQEAEDYIWKHCLFNK